MNMEKLKKEAREAGLQNYEVSTYNGTDHRGFPGEFLRESWLNEVTGQTVTKFTFLGDLGE